MNDLKRLKKSLNNAIQERLGYYVYRLIDPRNGETFYVGKGKGDRVLQHLEKAKQYLNGTTTDDKQDNQDKIDRIISIWLNGLDVAIVIHRHGLDEKTAKEVESALIDCYPLATNKKCGEDSERGTIDLFSLISKYATDEADIITDIEKKTDNDNIFQDYDIPIIIIKNNRPKPGNIYDNIRFAWRVNIERAQKVKYAFGVRKGIIYAMFEIEEWKEATIKNFPKFNRDRPGRYGFIGKEVPDKLFDRFRGKKLPDKFSIKGNSSPILYGWIKSN